MKHNSLCLYCGVEMLYKRIHIHDPLKKLEATRDHIMPRSRFPTYHDCTIRVCWGCNQSKDDLTLNEWRVVRMVREKRLVIFHFERSIWRTVLLSIPWQTWLIGYKLAL